MDLDGLPQFTVLEVGALDADGITDVTGELSHLRGVNNASG